MDLNSLQGGFVMDVTVLLVELLDTREWNVQKDIEDMMQIALLE